MQWTADAEGSLSEPRASSRRGGYGASRLIQANVPLSVVQRLLGHERITTTAIYIRALGDDIKEAVKNLEVL